MRVPKWSNLQSAGSDYVARPDRNGYRVRHNAFSIVEWDDRRHWVVWAVKGPTGANLGLYAFNAENISTVLYQPSGCPTRDAIGPVRFSVPTVANGYVFVGTQTDFDIFGTNPGTC